jgi:hypothetical protein
MMTLTQAELDTLQAVVDNYTGCNCGNPCTGTCTHSELLAIIDRYTGPIETQRQTMTSDHVYDLLIGAALAPVLYLLMIGVACL